ncbi:hypothetical protein K3495_g7722 [Podosphaera aphanis]|nr:hypothetical protein K3495_g7722 [Podosphaera aphanis]
MASKPKDGDIVIAFSGKWVSWVHTAVACVAFFGALIVGISLHYHKIVQNEYYGYPEEWFPSVSATIGDRYPERSFFMLFIAITAGPRFILVALWYLLTARPKAFLPKFVAFMGAFRSLTCGGWTYVTSTDDHGWHDVFMISYLVATLPWTLGCISLTSNNPRALRYRKRLAASFFSTLVPLVYYFIQHKVHKVAGAYTKYAFFEWSLIVFDVAFDAVTAFDFETFELTVKDVKGLSKGQKLAIDSVNEKNKTRINRQVLKPVFSWTETFDAIADVYNGFVFWSMLTSLGLLVWYFPLWYMGISGYEVLVMCTASPFLLGIPSIRSLVVRNTRYCHLLALSGLLAYLVKSPVYRLFTTSIALSVSCVSWAATWYSISDQPARLQLKIAGWAVGLIAHSVVKFAWQTSNPIWPITNSLNGGWNGLGFSLAILAVLRSTRSTAPSRREVLARKSGILSSILSGFGIAGLLFGMHSLLSDSSTMISWVWEGYPIKGPIAVPHGVWTITAMGAGLILGLLYEDFSSSWTYYGLACVGAATLTLYSNWNGYYGGLILTTYLMASSIPLFSSAARNSPAITFGLGFLVYNFMVLFHVWVVAYAFVPGGPLVREHTDWIMIVTMLLIGCGIFSNLSSTSASRQTKEISWKLSLKRTHYFYIIGLLHITSIIVAYLRFPTFDYTPYHKDDKVLTAGIWTVHFSLDNDMWSSEYRMRNLIKELELDVVGLLETDLQRIIMGNRDTSQFLAEELGMYADYGPGPNKHTWGCILLSKFPILNSTHHLLPSPVGELAPAIHATLDVYGELVDIFVFHSGQEEDVEDRRLQSQYLSKLMGASPRPSILLSYLVTKPLEGNYNTYVSETSGMHDIDSSDWDRWCEYILYKGLKRVGYARVSRGTITDTELQVGKFVVGETPSSNDEERNLRVSEDQIPEGRRFPQIFRGEGVRGHRYHVFDEPRYFN